MENQLLTYKVIGCAMKVHSTLGSGYREVIYQRALAFELDRNQVKFRREHPIKIFYEQEYIGDNVLDFLIEENLILELKAVSQLDNSHIAQVMNYCESTNLSYGLLINFGSKSLQYNRIYNKKYKKS